MTDERRWLLIERKARVARVVRAFQFFRAHGLEPILIKGLAVSVFYPADKTRLATDIDLAFSHSDFLKAKRKLKLPEAAGLGVDLHDELRQLDRVPWADLFANARVLELDGYPVRVLRPEDHLRVVCVHWLTNGGSDRDRLWDIYYMVRNRPADFDWDRFLAVVDDNRRRWLVCALGLAGLYLDLDLRDTPVGDAAENLPGWLISAVEREWASETHLYPLELSIQKPSTLGPQILRRLRPDPIFSTIQMEGSFDSRTRVFYQIGSNIKRIPSSIRRISHVLFRRTK